MKPSPFLWLFLFCVLIWGAMLGMLFSREVRLRWNANDAGENVSHYRVFVNGAAVLSASGTRASIEAQTGDTIHITAVNTAGESEASEALVIPRPPMDMEGASMVRVSSEESTRESTPGILAIDGQASTFWHTRWDAQPPHYIAVQLASPATCSALYYTPRQDGGTNGNVTAWEIESSMDGITWEPWASGTWAANDSTKVEALPLRELFYFRLWGSDRHMAAAEIALGGVYAPEPPVAESLVTLTLQQSGDLREWADLSVFTVPKQDRQFFRLQIQTP
jgi:hypothetical protein